LCLSFSSNASESMNEAAGGGQDSSTFTELIFAKEGGFSLADAGGTTVAQTSTEEEWLSKGLVVD
jgi:hypothetical protein